MSTPHCDRVVALMERVAVALNALGDRDPVALYVADQLDKGQFRVFARFDLNADGEADAYSLAYQVEVNIAGWWAPFCAPRWSDLGLSEDDVLTELANVRAQHQGDPAA